MCHYLLTQSYKRDIWLVHVCSVPRKKLSRKSLNFNSLANREGEVSVKIDFILYPGITKRFPIEVTLHLKFQIHQTYLYGISTVSIKLHFLVEKGSPIIFYRTTSLWSTAIASLLLKSYLEGNRQNEKHRFKARKDH